MLPNPINLRTVHQVFLFFYLVLSNPEITILRYLKRFMSADSCALCLRIRSGFAKIPLTYQVMLAAGLDSLEVQFAFNVSLRRYRVFSPVIWGS